MTMKARLARLETVHDSTARVIVIDGPEGIDVDAALSARAITATGRDLVVVIAKPATPPVCVTVDGQSVTDRIAGTVAST